MKKSIMAIGIIALTFIMVSYATAVPYSDSRPVVEKIKQIENLKEKLSAFIIGALIGLICIILGAGFLVPTYFFGIIGILFLDMGGTFAPGGLVFSLIGLGAGIISLILLSIGFTLCPALRNLKSVLLTFVIPLIITILLFIHWPLVLDNGGKRWKQN